MEIVTLAEVCDINPKHTLVGLNDGMEVSFVAMADVSEVTKSIQSSSVRRLGDVRKGFTHFMNNDVIVAKITPCYENGKMALVKLSRELGFGSTEFHIFRPDQRKILPKFLFYFLNSPSIRNDGEKNMTGSAGQKRVPVRYFQALQIPLPNLEEQKRIVCELDAADALRQKRKHAIALLDDYLKAVFLEMFGDPVTDPKGWKKEKFADVGTLDRGISKHRPRNAPKLLGGVHPLIQTGDVANAGMFIKDFHATYSDLGLRQSKKWAKGTLCITIAANIAKTGILTFDACFPDSVVGFIPNPEKTNNVFMHFWMSFFQKILEANAPESAQKNINLKILRDLDIIVPPIELQNKFAEVVKKVERMKEKMSSQTYQMDSNYSALIQVSFCK